MAQGNAPVTQGLLSNLSYQRFLHMLGQISVCKGIPSIINFLDKFSYMLIGLAHLGPVTQHAKIHKVA